jgi:hypothetical protein
MEVFGILYLLISFIWAVNRVRVCLESGNVISFSDLYIAILTQTFKQEVFSTVPQKNILIFLTKEQETEEYPF